MMKFFKNNYIKLFFLGLISSLAFAPTYLFFIFFYTFYYLLEALEENNKTNFLKGWVFGFGYFIGNCYWYCSSLLIEPLKFGWLIPFAISIIPAYLAVYIGFTTLFTAYIKIYIKNKFIITVIFSFFWTIFEYLRGILLTGFPWNLIGYSLGFSTILTQIVSIFGTYIFGFILILFYSCFYVLKEKKYKFYSIFYILIFIFILAYGFIKLNNNENTRKICGIRLVQPNVPQIAKIENNSEEILNNLLDLSLKNSENVEYVIWPESALPFYLFYANENYKQYNTKILSLLKERLKNKTLITGGIKVDIEKKEIFNSIFVIKNGEIIDVYSKNHLVPFGEYIPFSNIFKFLNTVTGTINLSSSNDVRKIIKINDEFPTFSPSICYESIFPNLVNKKADLIINVTNDAWFGFTSGPYQHLVASKFRALENNIPVLRVANSGITAFVDKNGGVIKRLKLGTRGIVDVCVEY